MSSHTAALDQGSLDDWTIFTIFRLVGFVLAVTGNSFIVFLIITTKNIRKERFNMFILLLAIGDIILGFAHLARVITQHFLQGSYTRIRCLVSGSLLVYGGHLAQFAMLLIAADRLYGIWHLHAVQIQRLNFVYSLSIPLSLIVCLIPAMAIFIGVKNDRVSTCLVGDNWTHNFGNYMLIHMIVFNVAICGLYILILVLYYRKVGNVMGTRNNFVAIVIGVASVYVSCWMIPKILSFSFTGLEFSDGAQLIAVLGELLSAVLNIFVYGFAHKEIRKAMKAFLFKTYVTVAPASVLTGY